MSMIPHYRWYHLPHRHLIRAALQSPNLDGVGFFAAGLVIVGRRVKRKIEDRPRKLGTITKKRMYEP